MRKITIFKGLCATVAAATLVAVPLVASGNGQGDDGRDPGALPGGPALQAQPQAEPSPQGGGDADVPIESTQALNAGNLTVDGSLCVGNDCNTDPPSPGYGFDTMRLMENNVRILAMDTSGGSFPTRDWQLEFNSSSNGGQNYFMVRDCGNTAATSSTCSGTPQFTIEAGADNDSIYVDSSGNQGGNVGFGTSSPAVDLDVSSGNTPTLRLGQDASSGFGLQTWDVAGNEANFFIRDVTGGSALPIRIEPGTASNTLYLDSQERIGFSTNNPEAALDLRVTNAGQLGLGSSALLLRRTGGGLALTFEDEDTGAFWNTSMLDNATEYRISRSGTGSTEFTVKESGIVTYRVFATAPTAAPAVGDVYMDTSGAFCAAFTAGTWTNIAASGTCV